MKQSMTPASPSGLGIVVPARNRPIHTGYNMLEYGFPEYGPCLQAYRFTKNTCPLILYCISVSHPT